MQHCPVVPLFFYLFLYFVFNFLVNRNEHIKHRLVFKSFIDFSSLLGWRTINGICEDSIELRVIQVRVVSIVEYLIVSDGIT